MGVLTDNNWNAPTHQEALKRPTIGQLCAINASAHKAHSYEGERMSIRRTSWERWPFRISGYYIGYRSVFGGITRYVGAFDEAEPVFTIQKTYRVWLFIHDERSAPFYAFPEDVTW